MCWLFAPEKIPVVSRPTWMDIFDARRNTTFLVPSGNANYAAGNECSVALDLAPRHVAAVARVRRADGVDGVVGEDESSMVWNALDVQTFQLQKKFVEECVLEGLTGKADVRCPLSPVTPNHACGVGTGPASSGLDLASVEWLTLEFEELRVADAGATPPPPSERVIPLRTLALLTATRFALLDMSVGAERAVPISNDAEAQAGDGLRDKASFTGNPAFWLWAYRSVPHAVGAFRPNQWASARELPTDLDPVTLAALWSRLEQGKYRDIGTIDVFADLAHYAVSYSAEDLGTRLRPLQAAFALRDRAGEHMGIIALTFSVPANPADGRWHITSTCVVEPNAMAALVARRDTATP